MDAPDVVVPGPSQGELALQEEQAQLLRQQREMIQTQLDMQQLMQPILLEQAGLEPIIEDGEIVGFDRIVDPQQEQLDQLQQQFFEQALAELQGEGDPEQAEIRQLLEERSLAALRGELPVDPGLERELSDQERELRERLRRQLGDGFETSTPGIQALSEFETRKQQLLEGARRGDLTLAEQLGLARQSSQQATIGDLFSLGTGAEQLGQSSTAALLSQAAGVSGLADPSALGALASGFGQALVPFQQQRAMQFNANAANAANQANTIGALFGGVGNLAGQALFTPNFKTTFLGGF